jgi:hypothetical protein
MISIGKTGSMQSRLDLGTETPWLHQHEEPRAQQHQQQRLADKTTTPFIARRCCIPFNTGAHR